MAEDEAQRQQKEQELIEQLQAELNKLKVSDLLLQTMYTVSSLGYQRISGEARDLDQARLAIEALRAILPVLEGVASEDVVRDFRQVTANLQLAYADAVRDFHQVLANMQLAYASAIKGAGEEPKPDGGG